MNELRYPQTLVDRILGRRGRLRLYERLEARRTALLVVDLQVHFMQSGSPAEMPSAREVVPAVNRLAGGAARAGRSRGVGGLHLRTRPGGPVAQPLRPRPGRGGGEELP